MSLPQGRESLSFGNFSFFGPASFYFFRFLLHQLQLHLVREPAPWSPVPFHFLREPPRCVRAPKGGGVPDLLRILLLFQQISSCLLDKSYLHLLTNTYIIDKSWKLSWRFTLCRQVGVSWAHLPWLVKNVKFADLDVDLGDVFGWAQALIRQGTPGDNSRYKFSWRQTMHQGRA